MLLKVTAIPYAMSGFVKSFHSGIVLHNASKAQLAKLRKKTGFSFVKCKEALVKFDEDFAGAEKWLRDQAQKEGWAKASKLKGRPMGKGVVAIARQDNMAAIVEVNCETDFVARNNKFQEFAQTVVSTALSHGQNSAENNVRWSRSELTSLMGPHDQPLSELLAAQIYTCGENMGITRGAFIKSGEKGGVGVYVHGAGVTSTKGSASCKVGQYGALVAFSQHEVPVKTSERLKLQEIGNSIGRHVVGMNPKSIGSMEDYEKSVLEKSQQKQSSRHDSAESSQQEEEVTPSQEVVGDDPVLPGKEVQSDDGEDRMVFQDFLADEDRKLGDFLLEYNVTVDSFVRYECGEEIEDEEESKEV